MACWCRIRDGLLFENSILGWDFRSITTLIHVVLGFTDGAISPYVSVSSAMKHLYLHAKKEFSGYKCILSTRAKPRTTGNSM